MKSDKIPYLIIGIVLIVVMFFFASQNRGEFGMPDKCSVTPLNSFCVCEQGLNKTSHTENGKTVYECKNFGG